MATKLTKMIADFETQLAAKTAIGGTTSTLSGFKDDDGVALVAGQYVLAVDVDNSQKEYWVATLGASGALTAISSLSRNGTLTAGSAREHRVGAKVKITDWGQIKYLTDLLAGSTDLDSTVPLKYDGTATISNSNALATKAYVDGVAIAGAPDSSATVKGITKLSVAPVSGANPIAVGDNDTRVPTVNSNSILTNLLAGTDWYAPTSTGTDAYAITLAPAPTAYANGMKFRFKADVANMGACTLNVNGLGAIAIKKNVTLDPASGDIQANQQVEVTYNSTGPVMELTSSIPTAQATAKFLTAGETIATGDPLYITKYPSTTVAFDAKNTFFNASSASFSNSFTVTSSSNRVLFVAVQHVSNTGQTVTGVTYNGVSMTSLITNVATDVWSYSIFYLLAPATGANTLTVNLSAATQLNLNVHSYYNAEQQAPEASVNASGINNAVFSANLIPLTNRALNFSVINPRNPTSVTGTGWASNIQIGTYGIRSADSGEISPLATKTVTQTADGSGIASPTWSYAVAPVTASSTARAYKTSASQSQTCQSFIGFADEAATVGTPVSINTAGVNDNQSSLNIGSTYYLGNTSGALSTTAGTVSRKVGVALSTTELVITNIA
jgi:hypothetical protein